MGLGGVPLCFLFPNHTKEPARRGLFSFHTPTSEGGGPLSDGHCKNKHPNKGRTPERPETFDCESATPPTSRQLSNPIKGGES